MSVSEEEIQAFQSAKEYYRKELKSILEPDHNGEVVVIKSETFEHVHAETEMKASKAFRDRFPGAIGNFFRIGHEVMHRIGTMSCAVG